MHLDVQATMQHKNLLKMTLKLNIWEKPVYFLPQESLWCYLLASNAADHKYPLSTLFVEWLHYILLISIIHQKNNFALFTISSWSIFTISDSWSYRTGYIGERGGRLTRAWVVLWKKFETSHKSQTQNVNIYDMDTLISTNTSQWYSLNAKVSL